MNFWQSKSFYQGLECRSALHRPEGCRLTAATVYAAITINVKPCKANARCKTKAEASWQGHPKFWKRRTIKSTKTICRSLRICVLHRFLCFILAFAYASLQSIPEKMCFHHVWSCFTFYRNIQKRNRENYIETFGCHFAALSLCFTGPSVGVEQQDELFSFRGLLNLCEQRLMWASWWLPLCAAARYWLILIDLYSCCNA